MKITIAIVMILLLMGCKSKQTLKQIERQNEKIRITSVKDSVKHETKIQEKSFNKEAQKSEQKRENETDFEVKGKAETNKPLEFYNVENGDTLQAIKVTGNAEVHFRAKSTRSNDVKKEIVTESFTEKLKEFSQNIVQENNLKERVSEMKRKTQEVTVKTGTFWSFWLIGGLTAFALLLLALFIYFKNYRKK